MADQTKVATNFNSDIAEFQLPIPFHLSLNLLSVLNSKANHTTMEYIKLIFHICILRILFVLFIE